MLDVLVATMGKISPQGLEYLPTHRVLTNTEAPWAVAANALLDQSHNDVLFIDDDITITPHTLDLLDRYYAHADLFGFTLMSPEEGWSRGWRTVSAGYVLSPTGALRPIVGYHAQMPCYVAHVTTSCIYLKSHVVQAGLRFPVWDGLHYEDVAFTLDAWMRGFKVAYLPGVALHPLTKHGAGQTKSADPHFQQKRAMNERTLQQWMVDVGVLDACKQGRIPQDPWRIVRD